MALVSYSRGTMLLSCSGEGARVKIRGASGGLIKVMSGEIAMKLTVAYHGGMRHDITSGKHRVVTDQPVEDGGQDAGMSPVELFVGSLAGCVGLFRGSLLRPPSDLDQRVERRSGMDHGGTAASGGSDHTGDSLAASHHGRTKRATPQSGARLHRASIPHGACRRGDRTQSPS